MDIKTLTINGQQFTICDPNAVRTDPQNLDALQKAQARSNIGAAADTVSDTSMYEQYFNIDCDGVVCLKEEYRGVGNQSYQYSISKNGVGNVGSLYEQLPEKLIIPDVINGTAVSGFQVAAFGYNDRLKEITIPNTVTELPGRLFSTSRRLKAVHNTEQIVKLGGSDFSTTQIEKLIFPNLKDAAAGSFAGARYLYSVDIGDNLTAIPQAMFNSCISLSLVKGGANVTTIGASAFSLTANLKNLALLTPQITSIGKSAFYQSRIQYDWSKLTNCTFGDHSYPTKDNTTDYWSSATFKPFKNEIGSILSQTNKAWTDQVVAYASWTDGGSPATYNDCCDMFCVMHIYSALTGMRFTHPEQFMKLLNDLDAPSGTNWMLEANKPGANDSANVDTLFSDLGFTVTSFENRGDSITSAEYQAMCDALARGAYIYTQTATASDANAGHAVIAYGINEIGEMLFLRPDNLCESYREVINIDEKQFYRMLYPNMSGPITNFFIVENK